MHKCKLCIKGNVYAIEFVFLACKPGYFGVNCSMSCPPKLYGQRCQLRCNCSEDECDLVLGCVKNNGKYFYRAFV